MAVQDRKSQVGAEELSVNVEVYQTSFEFARGGTLDIQQQEHAYRAGNEITITGFATLLRLRSRKLLSQR